MWGVDEIVCVPMGMLVMTKASRQEAFFFEQGANEQSAACTFHQKDTQLRRCGTHQQTNKRTNATNKYNKGNK